MTIIRNLFTHPHIYSFIKILTASAIPRRESCSQTAIIKGDFRGEATVDLFLLKVRMGIFTSWNK